MAHQTRRKRYRWETARDSLREQNELYEFCLPVNELGSIAVDTFPSTQQYNRRLRWQQSSSASRPDIFEEDPDASGSQYPAESGDGFSSFDLSQRPANVPNRIHGTVLKMSTSSSGSAVCGEGEEKIEDGREDESCSVLVKESCSTQSISPSSIIDSLELGSSFLSPLESIDCDKTRIQIEFERLIDFIFSAEISNISQSAVQRLLQTRPVSSSFSYRSLIAYSIKLSLLEKSSVVMCPNGHLARTGVLRNAEVCPTCNLSLRRGEKKFWYLTPSSALTGLCNSNASFTHIMDGCRKAKQFLLKQTPEFPPHDYYHGELFFRLHADKMLSWNESEEVLIFLSLSTDGFECGRDRTGNAVSTWPIVSSVLNFPVSERSKASNMIIHAIIPGTHESKHFETFLEPLLKDLKMLEEGIRVPCSDGRVRTLKAFLMYFTADWPAASKVFGYAGHNASLFCRYCCKEKTYFKNLKTSYAVPERTVKEYKDALRGSERNRVQNLVEQEFVLKRSHGIVQDVWRKLSKKSLNASSRKQISKETGIRKKPSLSLLQLDFVSSFPYDVMHLVLLGWVKQILNLITGSHARHKEGALPDYCIPPDTMIEINQAMSKSSKGIPTCWGRPPFSLESLAKYKAEDLKRHSELYLTPFLHYYKVDKKIVRIWTLTSRMVKLSFGYDCSHERISYLRETVDEMYARFVELVYDSKSQAFCFTPSTHAILHIPEILRDCGPLPSCSQFVVERLLGQIGKRVQNSPHLSAHIFHKNFRLLALRLSNDGQTPTNFPGTQKIQQFSSTRKPSESIVSEVGVNAYCNGPGCSPPSNWLSHERKRCIGEFVRQNFPAQTRFSIDRAREYGSTMIMEQNGALSIETFDAFRTRASKQKNCRQKHLIAAHFIGDNGTQNSHSSTLHSQYDIDRRTERDLYYGSVRKIFEVVLITDTNGEKKTITIVIADFLWHYDIIEDSQYALRYTEGRQVTSASTEIVQVINRSIGIVDLSGRRYFLDKGWSQRGERTEPFEETLRGVKKVFPMR